MQVTVTYLGVPVVALDAGVARTPAGAVAVGLGIPLGGYAAYRAGGRGAAVALELRDAHGALIPTTALRVARTPLGRRVVVFARFRHALAGVPARLGPAHRDGAAAARPSRRILALVLAVAAHDVPLRAQPARSAATARDTVDRFVAAEMARKHIPGVSLAVVRGGTVIKAQGYGLADLEHEVPVTPQTVFKIGSVSKHFLATGVMLLAQDGRLAVDDPVAKHFAGAPESWRGITLRHFLTHTSGVLREGPAFDPLKVQPDSVVVHSAFARPLEFPTGSKYQYCNVCYFALADVIARVSGKPWDVFLAERVFRPMEMTATRTTTTTQLVPHRARGYTWRDSGYVNAPELLALRPSGAFLSTVLDLAKWDAALYGDRMLTTASRAAMWTPVRLTGGGSYGYGFGWRLDSLDGRWRVSHGGSLPGFRAQMARFPNDSLTVIVLTNADGARPEEIAEGVARIYLSPAARPATRGTARRARPRGGA